MELGESGCIIDVSSTSKVVFRLRTNHNQPIVDGYSVPKASSGGGGYLGELLEGCIVKDEDGVGAGAHDDQPIAQRDRAAKLTVVE